MRIKNLLILPLMVLSLVSGNDTQAQGFDKLSFIGAAANYNLRNGTFDFGDGRRQDVGLPALFSGGVVLGKRWRLSDILRLQIGANINYGTVVNDTLPPLPLADGSVIETTLLAKFLYGGCVVDFQHPLVSAPGGLWYLHVGGGGHVVDMVESEVTLESPPRYVENDPFLVNQLALSASVQGGLGFEVVLSPRYGFCLDYSLRYWYPLHGALSRDLFPVSPAHYHERFLSHELGALLLVKRR